MKCPKCDFKNPGNTKFCGNCATPLPPSEETLDARTETISVPIADLKTGSVLANRYEIIEELGKGGMGKVYKALDIEINEKLAIKIIRPEIAANKKIIKRFHNELKMARKITHKNVCRMHDLGKDRDISFITMEYVSGEDLKKSVRRMGPLTIRKTIALGKQICLGLSEAHRLGVFHRDLKPHNIMIDREGNAKIMDFGIALSSEAREITDSNIMIGTPQYLSPEQAEGKKVDQRSDIYSLGVILFETVTGQVPFDGDTTLSIAVKHKSEIPRDPKEFNAQVPEELSQLILKCMEKDPEQRYQAVDELFSDLTDIEAEMPSTETTISKKVSKIKPLNLSRKLTRFPGILLLFFLVLVLGYFVYNQFLQKETDDTPASGSTRSENSIIVMPLRDLSAQKDQEPLHILMMEMLITNLHAFRELRVLPSFTSLAYQDLKKDIRKIGEELNVSHILEGSLWKTDGLLQVSIQLISVESGALIWTRAFEKPREFYLELQEEITKAVAKALGIKDVDERYPILTAKVPEEPITNEFYTRGRHYEILYYGTSDEKDFENSVQNYLKVVEDNPDDARTYWRLGNINEARYNKDGDETYLDYMLTYFRKAYEIDPSLAETNLGVGWSYFYKREYGKAYSFLKRAYEIDPDNAEINCYIGSFFRSIGLYEHALSHYSRALELDPFPFEFSLWHDFRAECYSYLGRFVEAAEFMRKALETLPDKYLYLSYAWQLIMMGRYGEAEIQILEAEKINPNFPGVRLSRALIFAARGDKESALRLIQTDDDTYLYPITSIYSLLGMKDEALSSIQMGIDVGIEERNMYLYSYPILISNPCYNNLRDDVRFQEILVKERAVYEEKMRKFSKF